MGRTWRWWSFRAPARGSPAAGSGAPDAAVEILSPSDTFSGIQEKTLDYLAGGARLVWIVDPRARTVTVFRADGTARLLRETDTLNGEDVLSGFAIALAELFGAI
ncbi:MAG: Uma2 family endonuclease [Gemmatimonadetes bacterium]|nr:Uma2 family endonuclease [Gemmatimonadota bacterium]